MNLDPKVTMKHRGMEVVFVEDEGTEIGDDATEDGVVSEKDLGSKESKSEENEGVVSGDVNSSKGMEVYVNEVGESSGLNDVNMLDNNSFEKPMSFSKVVQCKNSYFQVVVRISRLRFFIVDHDVASLSSLFTRCDSLIR
nr:hypothetical protein [Tanacetum cinerariifolium]